MREWNPFSARQWIAWTTATLIAAVTMTSFVYANFQTAKDAEKIEARIEKRLDRIENKQDQILERIGNPAR
jgi:cell division protein FtsL